MTTKNEDIARLFRSHYATMFALARRILGCDDTARDAFDVVHDVFARLLAPRDSSMISYGMADRNRCSA